MSPRHPSIAIATAAVAAIAVGLPHAAVAAPGNAQGQQHGQGVETNQGQGAGHGVDGNQGNGLGNHPSPGDGDEAAPPQAEEPILVTTPGGAVALRIDWAAVCTGDTGVARWTVVAEEEHTFPGPLEFSWAAGDQRGDGAIPAADTFETPLDVDRVTVTPQGEAPVTGTRGAGGCDLPPAAGGPAEGSDATGPATGGAGGAGDGSQEDAPGGGGQAEGGQVGTDQGSSGTGADGTVDTGEGAPDTAGSSGGTGDQGPAPSGGSDPAGQPTSPDGSTSGQQPEGGDDTTTDDDATGDDASSDGTPRDGTTTGGDTTTGDATEIAGDGLTGGGSVTDDLDDVAVLAEVRRRDDAATTLVAEDVRTAGATGGQLPRTGAHLLGLLFGGLLGVAAGAGTLARGRRRH